jgi:hypothetical protein
MDPSDLEIRNQTYHLFVDAGSAPSIGDVARETGIGEEDVLASWRRLHEQHALVLDGAAIRMANPFSAIPTQHRVRADNRWWYANCAWDAFGICAALHADGRVETSCPDCGEEIAIDVHDKQIDDQGALFHCLVPASAWWEDVVFT